MTAKALWHLSDQETTWLKTDLPKVSKEDCEIKTLFSFISLGTEKLVATGQVPTALADLMRVPYMEGKFDFPLKYGYSLVGEVLSKDHPLAGQQVHLMHPHQDLCIASINSLTVIPKSLPVKRALLTSNLETALNACWDAQVNAGDKIVVVGFGNIGALLACLLVQYPGIDLHIVEKDDSRRLLAKRMGFTNVNDSLAVEDFDLAFHSSGSSAGLQLCIDHLGTEGKVVELSWYGTRSVQVNLGSNFHHGRISIISSQVSKISSSQASRWDYKRRKLKVLELLQNPIFDHLVNYEISVAEAPAFFNDLRKGVPKPPGICIRY